MKNFLRLLISLAAFGLSMTAQAQDAQAGEKKAAMCIGCHGIPEYKASFPEIYRVPMIAGQNAKYISNALAAYKKGDRKHPSMMNIAKGLTDQDMSDLAAYYSQLGKSAVVQDVSAAQAPSTEVAALLTRGNCASCHGANFKQPIDASYPKLAGQHPDYLYAALRGYQSEPNPQVGRNNAIMRGMASQFTHAEAKLLASYIATMPGDLKTVPQSRWR